MNKTIGKQDHCQVDDGISLNLTKNQPIQKERINSTSVNRKNTINIENNIQQRR